MTTKDFLKLLHDIAEGTATHRDRMRVAQIIKQRLSLFNRLTDELEGALKEDAHIIKIKKAIKNSSKR